MGSIPLPEHDLGRVPTASLHYACEAHDESLPPYPVPDLAVVREALVQQAVPLRGRDTAARLGASLESLNPALESALAMTEATIKAVQRDSRRNWATTHFKTTLLSLSAPLAQSSITFKLQHKGSTQVADAALLLKALADVYASPTTVDAVGSGASGKVFETRQLSELFATARIPGQDSDRLESFPGSRHAVLWRNGQAFKVDLLDPHMQPYALEDFAAQVQYILACRGNHAGASVASVSTSLDRRTWASIRSRIQAGNAKDAKSLATLESAVVSVALHGSDEPDTDSMLERARADAADVYSDKTFGFSVFPSGAIAGRADHAAADGGVIFRVLEQLDTAMRAQQQRSSSDRASTRRVRLPEEVGVCYGPVTPKSVPQARPLDKVRKIVSIPQPPDVLDLLRSTGHLHVLVQLAFQAAVFSALGSTDALIVEPMSVRSFREGRCDPAYIASQEAIALFQAVDAGRPDSSLMPSFLSAARAYADNVRKTRDGQGLGPGILLFRNVVGSLPLSEERSVAMEALSMFERPTVYFTGAQRCPFVDAAEANVFASDQMAVTYLGQQDHITLCVAATGALRGRVSGLMGNFSKYLLAMGTVAVAAAAVEQMYPGEGTLRLMEYQGSRATPTPGAVAVHAGAGEMLGTQEHERRLIEFLLGLVVRVAENDIARGKAAVDVAAGAVSALENCVFFNSGKGSVYTAQGTHELEACIVDGSAGASGAVACVKGLRNPVRAAVGVMKLTRHSLLAGDAADRFGLENGFETVPNSHFDSHARKQQAGLYASNDSATKHPQTVGAVVLDSAGRLAAASSTGGVVGKLAGRIGDTAIVGAGTFADRDMAVACSGHGDAFLRHSIASVVARCRSQAEAQRVLDDLYHKTGAAGGVVALAKNGRVSVSQTAASFFVGASEPGKEAWARVVVPREEETPPFFRHELLYASLSHHPSTRGDTVVRLKSGPLGDMTRADFQNVFFAVKQAASVLKTALGVGRVALVTTSGPEMRLVPLHGLSESWESTLDPEDEFHDQYPGYISSRNGPRLAKTALDKTCDSMTGGAAQTTMDTTFVGDEKHQDSLFAKIVRGKLEQWRVWDGPGHVAFLTPFANTPGFTVLVPRRRLSSDIFELSDADLFDLAGALHDVSSKIRSSSRSVERVGIIFEGMEIDYAHAKLIPIRGNDEHVECPYHDTYTGSVSSKRGPAVSSESLAALQSELVQTATSLKVVQPPRTLAQPATHYLAALKSPWYRGLFRILDTMFASTAGYFGNDIGYKYALTPITTDCISSPMGLGSDSLPVTISLLGQETYLADSMQFTLEYLLRFDPQCPGAYYISPSFRGEDPDSTHLNQFFHVECELRGTMQDAMGTAERYIEALTRAMYANHRDLIQSIAGTTEHMTELLGFFDAHKSFAQVTLDEAIDMMPSDDCWEYAVEGDPHQGRKLTRKGEQFLLKRHGGFVWLTEMDHLSVPFYQAYTDDSLLKAKAADLLMGLGETLGMGERHVTADHVRAALDHHEVPHAPYEWYLAIRDVQAMQTSGWGMGSERYLCWLLAHDDVRNMALIPRLKGTKFLP